MCWKLRRLIRGQVGKLEGRKFINRVGMLVKMYGANRRVGRYSVIWEG